jgi:hypothetical protein
MIKPVVTVAPGPAAPVTDNHLRRLVARTADGDRAAFRCLYGGLALAIWRTATAARLGTDSAAAVTRATFVEVWHRAGSFDPAVDGSARAWITSIGLRRAGDRLRTDSAAIDHAPTIDVVAHHDTHIRRELAALSGTGPATVRVAAAILVRVGCLDRVLPAITAAHPQRGGPASRPVTRQHALARTRTRMRMRSCGRRNPRSPG